MKLKELLDTFKKAENHWIPFRPANPGEEVNGFSHKDYTELVFSNTPTTIRLEREFNLIFFDDNSQGLKLLKAMWDKLEDSKKERFYRQFALKLSERIDNNSRAKLVNLFIRYPKTKKRAEIYLDKLEKLYNEFYFNDRANVSGLKEVSRTSVTLPLQWRVSGEYKKGHIKDFLAWASIPFETEVADIERTEAVQFEYFTALAKMVGVELSAQPSSNISAAKRIGSFTDIAERFIKKFDKMKKV